MSESSQRRIGRVRPPRVQITYDVEDGGAVESRELPMVVGVISDLSGETTNETEYSERGFVEIDDGGGVGRLMKTIGPTVKVTVQDEVSGDEDKEIAAALSFGSLDDFSPMGVAAQMPQTARLLEVRQKLADLYGKVEANDKLEGLLGEVLANEEKRERLQAELGLSDDDAAKGDS